MKKENAQNKFSRRAFLAACASAGAGLVIGGALQSTFDVANIARGLRKVSLTRISMGTFVTITALHEVKDQAQEAIGAAFDEIDRLVALFSRHDSASPLAVWNRDGVLNAPPPELTGLLTKSLHYHQITEGAFDVTVKPVVELLERSGGQLQEDDVDSSMNLIGIDKVEISADRLRFRDCGMGVTLDGIAKGAIVDRASEVLSGFGIANHLINAGGDIRARSDGSRRPWTIAVEDPEKRRRYPEVLRLANGAVATSGSYEVYYDHERLHHHLIDPRSGLSPHHTVSVSILARSVLEADALSTAAFIHEPHAALSLIDRIPGAAGLIIGPDEKQFQSRRWGSIAG